MRASTSTIDRASYLIIDILHQQVVAERDSINVERAI